MTEAIFSFDTENFTNPINADAILNEAKILRAEGIKGNFLYVGLLCRQLEEWGRQDVIDEMRYHYLGTHSHTHTLHPVVNEYTDIADPMEAERLVTEREGKAVEEVKRVFHISEVRVTMPPGLQHSYAAMYAFAKMGLLYNSDTFIDYPNREGTFFCDQFHTSSIGLEEWLFTADDAEIKKVIDEATQHNYAVFATHPDKALCAEWWDEINYMGKNSEWGKWKMSKLRPWEDTARFYINYRKLVQMVKADPRFHITTYGEVLEKVIDHAPDRIIKAEDIPQYLELVNRDLTLISEGKSCCLSDLFLAGREMLLGAKEHKCGFVYGFLETPIGITVPTTVTKEEMVASAMKMNVENYLPANISVGGKMLGAGDWLRASLEIISGKDAVTLLPGQQMPSLEPKHPLLAKLKLKGKWCFSPDFEDRYLSDRLRLQTWTMRH